MERTWRAVTNQDHQATIAKLDEGKTRGKTREKRAKSKLHVIPTASRRIKTKSVQTGVVIARLGLNSWKVGRGYHNIQRILFEKLGVITVRDTTQPVELG